MAGRGRVVPGDVPCNIQHAGELLFASGGSLAAADAVDVDERRDAVAVLGFSGRPAGRLQPAGRRAPGRTAAAGARPRWPGDLAASAPRERGRRARGGEGGDDVDATRTPSEGQAPRRGHGDRGAQVGLRHLRPHDPVRPRPLRARRPHRQGRGLAREPAQPRRRCAPRAPRPASTSTTRTGCARRCGAPVRAAPASSSRSRGRRRSRRSSPTSSASRPRAAPSRPSSTSAIPSSCARSCSVWRWSTARPTSAPSRAPASRRRRWRSSSSTGRWPAPTCGTRAACSSGAPIPSTPTRRQPATSWTLWTAASSWSSSIRGARSSPPGPTCTCSCGPAPTARWRSAWRT